MSLEDLSLEQRDELAALAKTLADNPQTRKDFLRLTKTARPDVPIPELDIDESLSRVSQNAESRVAQLEAKLREKEALEELNRRREKVKKSGLAQSDADIEAIEKVMIEKGITNHEAAAEYHQWMKQAAQPTPTGYNPQVLNKFDLSKYYKNPVGAARDEAAKALAELRGPRRPIGL
jgi:DNA-binding protein H-NS